MQILKSLHQKFNTKPLLWSEGLFVFDAPEGPSFDEKIDTAQDTKDSKVKTLTNPKEIKKEAENEFNNAIKKLKTAYTHDESHGGVKISAEESASLQLFNEKSNEFQNKLSELTNVKEDEDESIKTNLITEGNNLLKDIKTRITASKKEGGTEDNRLVERDFNKRLNSANKQFLLSLGIENDNENFDKINKAINNIKLTDEQKQNIANGEAPDLTSRQEEQLKNELVKAIDIRGYSPQDGKKVMDFIGKMERC